MDPFILVSFFISFILGITVHESAHALMAHKLGDTTAKDLGRISLNPLRHIDPIGTVLLPILGMISPSHAFFGWAKPTPYNPHNLKDGVKDEILIAIAGPLSNLILAVLVFGITFIAGYLEWFLQIKLSDQFYIFTYYCIVENLILAFFNLLPIPPLDGSSFLKAILPKRFSHQLAFFNQYGFYILILSSMTPAGNVVGMYIDACVGFCMKLIGYDY